MNWLKRQWFLCILLAMLPAGFCIPGPGLFIKQYFTTTYMVWSLLFFSAYGLATGEIVKAFTGLRSLLSMFVLSYGVAPLLAYSSMLVVFGKDSDYSIGLLLSASAPSTLGSSIIWTRLGRGNDAMALAGTLIMNLLAFITVPVILKITLSQEIALDAAAMAKNLFVTLLLPVLLGQLARTANKKLSDRLKNPVSVLNQVIILLLILTAISTASREAGQRHVTAGAIVLVIMTVGAVHALTMAAGWYGSILLGISREDRVAVAVTGSQKTLAVSMYIREKFFPAYPFAILPVLFFHATQLVIDSLVVDMWKRKADACTNDGNCAAQSRE